MINQKANRDADKGSKNSSKTMQKTISANTFIISLLILLTAFGIGMVIREYRLRAEKEKYLAQAPEPIQTPDIPETQNNQNPIPVEKVFIAPEPASPKPLPTTDTINQSNKEVQPERPKVPQYQDTRLNDPVFKEQLGRYALSFVGYDPAATEIWAALINDPSLSDNVRQDLIEDLNENGFSGGNGRTPTADDLPLILYRIQLIESFAPYAMDEVNMDAFDEVYKDLTNMVSRLTQQ